MKKKIKRFSVSLEENDYQKLVDLAEGQRPQLTFNYVVSWAILRLLDMADDPTLASQLGNPLAKRKSK